MIAFNVTESGNIKNRNQSLFLFSKITFLFVLTQTECLAFKLLFPGFTYFLEKTVI